MAPTSLAALALVMMSTIGALPVKPGRAVFLGISRQPAEIANLLVDVEDVWKMLFASCDPVDNSTSTIDCRQAPAAFAKSCETVVQAVTEGASAEVDLVEEYMRDICGQDVLKGLRRDRCKFLCKNIVGAMSFKTWAKNGVVLDKKRAKVCTDIWSKFTLDEQIQRDAERKRKAAKAAEDRVRKAEELKTEVDAFRVKVKAAKARADNMTLTEAEELKTEAEELKTKVNASAKHMSNATTKDLVATEDKVSTPKVNASTKDMVNATNASSAK